VDRLSVLQQIGALPKVDARLARQRSLS
jgi:hypothetical protein